MELSFLTDEKNPMYQQAFTLYRMAFPREERRENDCALVPHKAFRPGILLENGKLQGILFYWEAADFIYLEHFAVLPQYRNLGLGAKALALLKGQGKPIVLEIEPPVDDLTCRRRGFYQRNGFLENEHPHIQPKYRPDDEDLPLKLLSWPQRLTRERWQALEDWLQENVAAHCDKF